MTATTNEHADMTVMLNISAALRTPETVGLPAEEPDPTGRITKVTAKIA